MSILFQAINIKIICKQTSGRPSCIDKLQQQPKAKFSELDLLFSAPSFLIKSFFFNLLKCILLKQKVYLHIENYLPNLQVIAS